MVPSRATSEVLLNSAKDERKDERVDAKKVIADLNSDIEKHPGEMILVVERGIENDRDCFGPRYRRSPLPPQVKEEMKLGVLKGGKVIYDEKELLEGVLYDFKLPTSRYAYCENRSGKTQVFKGGILVLFPMLKFAEKMDPEKVFTFKKEPISQLEVIVGNEAVIDWFKKQRGVDYLMAFRSMARLLGIEIPEFPEVEEELKRRKKNVIEEIITLHINRVSLRGEIARTHSRVGTFLAENELGSKCDAFFVTGREREELKRIDDDIKRIVRKAKELSVTLEEICNAFLEASGIKESFAHSKQSDSSEA